MVVKSEAKSVGWRNERCRKNGQQMAQFRRFWCGSHTFVTLRMTIFSQYRERRDGCMILGVFEVKKEIPNEPDEQGNSDG
jgi:hypothetical protein